MASFITAENKAFYTCKDKFTVYYCIKKSKLILSFQFPFVDRRGVIVDLCKFM